jgi:UDP-N-acetylglucosamine 2-epimerase
MKVITVVGARPHFPKAAVVSRELRARGHDEVIVHTGQHYDDQMSHVFFRQLGLPSPHVNLDAGPGTHAAQTARMLEGLETVFVQQRPDVVMVYGDTNSTLAGALAAAKLDLPVAHVEAGFRSYNRSMPEEVNRVVTDHVSRYLFCPTQHAVECLECEGIVAGVHLVGDVMFDSLLAAMPKAQAMAPDLLRSRSVSRGAYYLATIHRAANTDDPGTLRCLFEALGQLDAPVILPLHPRTRAALPATGIEPARNVRLEDPVGYIEMLALEANARAVLTDSGGVQREAYFLEVPCVTLRQDTEWPELLTTRWNTLAGCDPTVIVKSAQAPRPSTPPPSVFGDGTAAKKIVEILNLDPPIR